MALSSPNLSFTIDNEIFSLVEIPQAGTELVKREKKSILGELDLESLVADLGKLGSFIRVAYNGVAGNTELQIKVQRVGYKITKLTDESAVTVHKFRQTSKNVLQELQGTYQFLLDGIEEMALETLAALAHLVKDMAKAAEELHEKFEEATTDVIDALEDTQTAKGVREDRKKELQEQQAEFKLQQQKETHLLKDAGKAKEKAEAKMAMLDTEEARKVLGSIGDDSDYKETVKNANKEKMKHLEELQKQRDIRREAIQKCIDFTEKIINCKTDEGLEQAAIDALHNSIGALKSLSAIMMNAALFWRQMHAHCESLAKEDMQRMIERAMKYPEEKRLKVWTSAGFKSKGITYCSKWVALDDICGTYVHGTNQANPSRSV